MCVQTYPYLDQNECLLYVLGHEPSFAMNLATNKNI